MEAPVQDLFTINNLWMMISTLLIFIMHLGFATLEAGLTRAKNTVNILFKNTIIPAIGLLTYALVGFNLMYPGAEFAGSFFGFSGFGLSLPEGWDSSNYNAGYTYFTDFIFQAMFAATAATIVSGAVAERMKLGPFIAFSLLYVGFCYPVVGMWKWGGGFLNTLETPFYDFAGSTIVHTVGGWAALVGAFLLGPRIGKYTPTGMKAIPGHNIPMATMGVFLLWFGWFGFNAGSALAANGIAGLAFMNTQVATAGALIGWILVEKLRHGHATSLGAASGAVSGLVAITPACAFVAPWAAVVIGFIAGILCSLAVDLKYKFNFDDSLDVVGVHLVGGVWGSLSVGFFGASAVNSIGVNGLLYGGGSGLLVKQAMGVGLVAAYSFIVTLIIGYAIEKTIGFRVAKDSEVEGIDLNEHAESAYEMSSSSRGGSLI